MMNYIIRSMRRSDINPVTAIDREAFSTMWPPMNYHREMENQLACYLVLSQVSGISQGGIETEKNPGLVEKVKTWITPNGGKPKEKIIGFAGFWMMADEAHIISLAVRKEYRRRGFGEFLLLELMEESFKRHAVTLTLEVRVSNYEAQRLYIKNGFSEKGIRKAYYTDNREDALIMTIENIESVAWRDKLNKARAKVNP